MQTDHTSLIAEARADLSRQDWQEITEAAAASYRMWSRRATQDARAEDQYEWHLADAIRRAYSGRLLRLAAALEAATQWRPIETAPKGETVLLFQPGEEKRSHSMPSRFVVGRVGDYPFRQPTHWLPLTTPPPEESE